jgi:hypothetical protein
LPTFCRPEPREEPVDFTQGKLQVIWPNNVCVRQSITQIWGLQSPMFDAQRDILGADVASRQVDAPRIRDSAPRIEGV